MTNRFSRILAAATTAVALTTAGAAHATAYQVTFSDGPVAGSFVATTTGSLVTGITGWVTDSQVGPGTFNITGLDPFASADQQFFATSPFVDYSGLSFATAGGGAFNFASSDGTVYLVSSVLDPNGTFQEQGLTAINPTVTAVPEPASVGMMLAAAGMFGVMASRRRAR